MSENLEMPEADRQEANSATQDTRQSESQVNSANRTLVKLLATGAVALLLVGATASFFVQENAKHESFRQVVREYVARATVGDLDSHELQPEIDLLLKITSAENHRFLSSDFPQDKEGVLIKSAGLSSKYYDARGASHEAQERIKELDGYIEACRSQLMALPRDVKTFLIYRQFDTTSDGDGLFEATQMSTYMKCVLVAEPSQIEVFAPNTVRLLADAIGKQPYTLTRFNAFQNFQVTEYFDTYKVKSYEKESQSIRELLSDHQRNRFEASKKKADSEAELNSISTSLNQIGEAFLRAMPKSLSGKE